MTIDGIDCPEMEVQSFRATLRNNTAGVQDATTVQDVLEMEPAGGIKRTERAELLALVVHVARAEVDSTGDSNMGIRGGWELSRDEDPEVLTQNRTQVDLSGNAYEGDDPGGDVLSRQVVSTNPDLLWATMLRADTTSNSNGTTSQTPAADPETVLKYKDWFGNGPFFQASDEIHLHGRYNVIDYSGNFVNDIIASLYWKVEDCEDC